MPSLVRTPGQRKAYGTRTPNLKPSTEPDLQVAGLQECATLPVEVSGLCSGIYSQYLAPKCFNMWSLFLV